MNTANVVIGDAVMSARSFHCGWLVALAVQVESSAGTTGKAEAVQQIICPRRQSFVTVAGLRIDSVEDKSRQWLSHGETHDSDQCQISLR